MTNRLLQVVAEQGQGKHTGIYSICSANRYAIEAAILQAKADESEVLIEATSNQVNQFGGYTGMTPQQFVIHVRNIASAVDFPFERVLLGGDHLGPNAWQEKPARKAMVRARELIQAYISVGFTKIHLDTSMRLGDDPGDHHTTPDPTVVAERAADLCFTAEEAHAQRPSNSPPPLYVIGTDVPTPGGAQDALEGLHITTVEEAEQTIQIHKEAFNQRGLEAAWERVIGVVVQPGVEFGDASIIGYQSETARSLSQYIERHDNLVYEAHSTDYQTRDVLCQMVEDHFAILKVGPWLTFAFREAIFALAYMETEWLAHRKDVTLSRLREVLEEVMVAHPEHWQKHYQGDDAQRQYARTYSYFDRVRYYWPRREVTEALNRLLDNLTKYPVPLTLLSQAMPAQSRAGRLYNTPVELIRHKVMEVTGTYAWACGYAKPGRKESTETSLNPSQEERCP